MDHKSGSLRMVQRVPQVLLALGLLGGGPGACFAGDIAPEAPNVLLVLADAEVLANLVQAPAPVGTGRRAPAQVYVDSLRITHRGLFPVRSRVLANTSPRC